MAAHMNWGLYIIDAELLNSLLQNGKLPSREQEQGTEKYQACCKQQCGATQMHAPLPALT